MKIRSFTISLLSLIAFSMSLTSCSAATVSPTVTPLPTSTSDAPPTATPKPLPTSTEVASVENFGPPQVEWASEEPAHDWDNMTQAQMESIWLKSADTKLTDGVGQELPFGEAQTYGIYSSVYGVVVEAPTDGRDITITMPVFDGGGKKVLVTKTIETKLLPFLIKNAQGNFQIVEMVYPIDLRDVIIDFGPNGIRPTGGNACLTSPGGWNKFLNPNTRIEASIVNVDQITDDKLPDMRTGEELFKSRLAAYAVMTATKTETNSFISGTNTNGQETIVLGNFSGVGVRVQPGELQGLCK